MTRHRESRRFGWYERDLDCENRARTKSRANVDLVPEQISKALHDCKAETETLASLPRRIVELMELFKDRLQFHSGMPGPVSQTSMRSLSPDDGSQVGVCRWLCTSPHWTTDCG